MGPQMVPLTRQLPLFIYRQVEDPPPRTTQIPPKYGTYVTTDGHGVNIISPKREVTQLTTIRTCHKELSNRDQDRQEDFVPSLFVVTRKMLPLYHSADRLCSDTEVTQHTCFSGQPSGSATPGRVQLQGPVHETDTAAGATPQSTKPWVCCYQNGRLSNM